MWIKARLAFIYIIAAIGLVAFFTSIETSQGAGLKPKPYTAKSLTETVRFGVIGDFGLDGANEANVATLVKGWSPSFIVTLGDNNYYSGAASTIDKNMGKYYHDYMFPYSGSFGNGAADQVNHFFPVLGNHDWNGLTCTAGTCTGPYFNYFTLPNNERYYDFVQGPVHFFMLDSDPHEPDGVTSSSTQANWLHTKLAAAQEPWKLVLMHHPPYSSGATHGSTSAAQWPYADWGASAVLSGHDHTYERIMANNIPYFVNGLGGAELYNFATPVAGSTVRYSGNYGAMLVEASTVTITFQFRDVANTVIDTYSLSKTGTPSAPTITPTTTAATTPTTAPLATPNATTTPPSGTASKFFYLPWVKR